jgi:phage shock protein E
LEEEFMSDNNVIVIDVRTPAEYKMGHAEKSLNLDIFSPSFLDELGKLDKGTEYQLYCRTGNRSGQAEALMKQLGFANAKNVGGLDEAGQLYNFIESD